MMVENNRLPGDYYRRSFIASGESEGSGSSGRITEFTVSEDSSAPARKCINLNSKDGTQFYVPSEVFPLSKISQAERKDLVRRLRLELEQIRILQKRIESQKITGVTLSSSSDILSCSNGQNGMRAGAVTKSSVPTSEKVKKVGMPEVKGRGWNRGATGKFESAKPATAPKPGSTMLMKECETLLKRLMTHQYGWVFKKPVDIKALNIPDYFDVIKHPMDLGTIKGKLGSGSYSSPLEFLADVRLTFSNAMTYNPPGNDVHLMADTLSKFFEVRWKTIEKKLVVSGSQPSPAKSGALAEVKRAKSTSLPKKRKMKSQNDVIPEPPKQVMTDEEKHKLGQQLESLLGEMPDHMVDFLREHSSNGKGSVDEEIEIDIDDLSNDVLLALRKLLDEYLQEKQKKLSYAEPCEIEILNESGFSNSSMPPYRGNNAGDEDIDIGENEPPVSSHSPMEVETDVGHRTSKHKSSGQNSYSEIGYDHAKASSPENVSKAAEEIFESEAQQGGMTRSGEPIDINQSISGLDQLEQTSLQKAGSVESDCFQDGESAPSERQLSPEKLYRAALLKNRFADTILKAREKTLVQGDKGDPEKLRREREELEMQRRKEKARLQAEAKAAEDARRRKEAEALAEAKRKRELEREAARQALLKMEKTVEINENSRFLEDLEMLSAAPVDHLPSSADETSPEHNLETLGSFKLGGSNPLEQLGLFMKADEDEEEGEPSAYSNREDDVEEGEID